jgi:hypothetical protein
VAKTKLKNGTKAKNCTDAPIMLYRGRIWNILKVEPMIHGFSKKVFAYKFHIKDEKSNYDIRVCDEDQRLKIPDY